MTSVSLQLIGQQKQLHAPKVKKVRLGLLRLIIGAIQELTLSFPLKSAVLVILGTCASSQKASREN